MTPDQSLSSAATTNGHASPDPRPAGLRFARMFSRADLDPFAEVAWGRRTAEIKGDDGKVIFTQDVEVPAPWSQLATNVVASKYFYGDAAGPNGHPEAGGREDSVRQLVGRVARTIADWGIEDGYFATDEDGDRFHDELAWLCLNQHGSFNSPVWFNVGLSQAYGIRGAANGWTWDARAYPIREDDPSVGVMHSIRGKTDIHGGPIRQVITGHRGGAVPCRDAYVNPQVSACFIQSVRDDMGSICDLQKAEMMLFKFGSGTGTDYTPLRSRREKLSGGGRPSGPLSFIKVSDAGAGVVKSGGVTRRAAMMKTLKVHHPDILDFIDAKVIEERKAQALIAQGYPADFNGEAYGSVAFQNANFSVRVTDEFLAKVAGVDPVDDLATVAITEADESMPIHSAGEVMGRIAAGTWECGDPGLQYEDTIQRWHTCPNTAPINSSNPCSEYMFIDDSACNLASLNLMKFLAASGGFLVDRFRLACRTFIVAQDILVGRASYPTASIAENSHKFRPLGLGYCGLGALLMASGLPYDSDEGRSFAGAVTAIMHGQANLTSAEMAEEIGPFEGFAANREPMLDVIDRHAEKAVELAFACDHTKFRAITNSAESLWCEVQDAGRDHGFRNSQVTVLAPTGTIAFMMDSGHSTGIEPATGLVVYKTLAGGGRLKVVNPVVPMALRNLGVSDEDTRAAVAWIAEHDSLAGWDAAVGGGWLDSHPDAATRLAVFDCAFADPVNGRSIAWEGHVRMMAACQPFLSGAISKTCNLPADATVEDIRDAYLMGWRLGLKALAIYRDGSKGSQPVNVKKADIPPAVAPASPIVPPAPRRERLPDTRRSLTHKLSVGGVEAYATVGLYPDGRPGELFVEIAKEGSTVGGLMDAWATAISIGLQYGVPLGVLVDKFSGGRFEPHGMTQNPDVPFAKSLIDYIARWLGMEFVPGYRELHAPDRDDTPAGPGATQSPAPDAPPARPGPPAHAPTCGVCGSLGTPNGACWVCGNCGTSIGGCG